MWMKVGIVNADVQKLSMRDMQKNHVDLIRTLAKNEVGLRDPSEFDELAPGGHRPRQLLLGHHNMYIET
ncbi:Titin [Eufriesea mexicana]|uniref:Titin n=1 Tax=Eufriesea mexicana TaxID=516756 RepID=A0A310SJR2_9HYME|nr:Titin [Eufriesea mexicana]